MSERGESRAIYTTIKDDPDFLALSPESKLVWYTLKMRLGASAIDRCYDSELAELTGFDLDQITKSKAELRATRWIVFEGNVIWIRNGLRFDPYLSMGHERHKKGIAAHLRGLPKLGIVNVFADYYGFEELPFPDVPFVSLKEGLGMGHEGDAKQDAGFRIQDSGEKKNSATNVAGAGAPTSFPQKRSQQNGEKPWNAQLLPVLRECNFAADDTDADLCKRLVKLGVPITDIEAAIRGLRLMCEQDQLEDVLGLKAGEQLNMKMLVAEVGKEFGFRPIWNEATEAYWAELGRKPPQDGPARLNIVIAKAR